MLGQARAPRLGPLEGPRPEVVGRRLAQGAVGFEERGTRGHALREGVERLAQLRLALRLERGGRRQLQLRVQRARLGQQPGLALRCLLGDHLGVGELAQRLGVRADLGSDAALVRGQLDGGHAHLGQLALLRAQPSGEALQLHRLQTAVGAGAEPEHRRQPEDGEPATA